VTAPADTASSFWSVVLVEPARGGNIGAAARAMKTMGFRDLRIVDPCGLVPPKDDAEARAFAHGSTDILEEATRWPSLAAAVSGYDVVVGTTGRRRGKRTELYTPEEVKSLLVEGPKARRIALVFGPEERGLSNEELDLCDITSAVPMRSAYPSLNLGQAVMVYTYALSPLVFSTERRNSSSPTEGSIRAIHEKAERLLPRLGFDPGRAIFTRILERVSSASETDARLIHSVLNALEKRFSEDLPERLR
jgi:tRNA/rRNA methyltransferase